MSPELPETLSIGRRVRGLRSPAPVCVIDRVTPPPPPAPPDVEALVGAVREEGRLQRDRLEEVLGDFDRECVALCTSALGRLLYRTLDLEPAELAEPLLAIAEEHRGRLAGIIAQVRVHPADGRALRDALVARAEDEAFEVVDDATLERGSLRLDCGHTSLVRTLGDELRALTESWAREVRA